MIFHISFHFKKLEPTEKKNLTVGSGFGRIKKSSLRLLNLLHIVSFPLEYPQTLSTIRSRLSKNAKGMWANISLL